MLHTQVISCQNSNAFWLRHVKSVSFSFETTGGTDEDIVRPTAIQVSGLPDEIDNDTLVMIFEHQKYGGGKVNQILIDPIKKSAIIEFEEANGKYYN